MSAIATLNAWADAWAAAMLGSLVDTTVLFVLLAGLWWLVRRRASAQFGYCLFLLVLLKVLVPLPIRVPAWLALSSPRHAVARLVTPTPAEVSAAALLQAPGVGERAVPQATAPNQIPVEALAPAERLPGTETVPTVAKAAEPVASPSVVAVLMLGWAGVVAVWLVAFAWTQGRAARLLGRACAGAPGLDPADFDALRRQAGVRQRVGLVVTPLVSSPAVWGLFCPRVLLPAGLAEQLSPPQLRWVLLHELAHVRRADLWVLLLQRVVQAVYFFNPAVWLANRLIDQQREYACDDAALAASALPRRVCGAVFLTLVERATTSPALAAPGLGLFRYQAFVQRRLLRILDVRRPIHPRLSAGAAALLAGLAMLVLPCLQAEDPPTGKGTPPADRTRPATSKDEGEPLVYSGRVLDPDGKPLPGAKVFLVETAREGWKHRERATSGPEGRFRFTVARSEFDRSRKTEPWTSVLVAATAEACGPVWESAGRPAQAASLTLRLAPDDVPIKGRVIDLEGRPVPGVTITLGTLSCRADADGKSVPFDAPPEASKSMAIMPLDPLVPYPVTDADGRFTLTGIGRDRILEIGFSGPTIEQRWAEVVTRPQPTQTLPGTGISPPGREPKKTRYGSTFVHVAGPTKPIVGVVRDEDTGKPLANMMVYKPFTRSDEPSGHATTDAEGRYRLVGLGRGGQVELKVVPQDGQPYFARTFKVRMDTPAFAPVTADVPLKRRPVIAGRLTDRATGRPVRAWITYRPLQSNPHVARAPGDVEESAESGDDGRFRVPAMPGTGVLLVRADQARDNRYLSARLDPTDPTPGLLDAHDRHLLDTAPRPALPEEYNAYRVVEVPEKAASFSCDLTLDPGRAVAGKVVDPDGKSLAAADVFGLGDSETGGYQERLDGADFTAYALDPARPRRLYFYHEARRLGGSLVVRGDEPGPVTARLQPLASVRGRLLDGQGKPVAGASFQLIYAEADGRPRVQFPGGWRVLTPEEERRQERARGYLGKTLITGPEKTDADGRFRIPRIVPGLTFELRAHVAVPAPDIAPNASRVIGDQVVARSNVRPGEDHDLGEVHVNLNPERGKPGR
jgi:beta-lactamase regulating signal transducer with metallopeptidase domain/protocatechuate 3,4-dioxygenase beta subunit